MGANSIIQVRRGLFSEWSGINPTLAGGEIGYETDNKKGKIGDGSTSYLSLPYVIGTGATSGGGGGTVLDAFKFITTKGAGGLTITASGSGDTLNFTGVAPLSIGADASTKTLSFNISSLSTGDVQGFSTGVKNIISTNLIDGKGINFDYNAIDDALTIEVTGVPFFDTSGNLTLEKNLTVQGDLTVQGSSITANSTDVNIGDNLITVNVTEAVASGGLRVYRSGTNPSGYANLLWNENTDRWIFNVDSGTTAVQAETFVGNLSGVVSGSLVGDVQGNATSASTVYISGDAPSDATTTFLLTPRVSGTGNTSVIIDQGLRYNTISNTLTADTFVGSLQGTGDAATKAVLGTSSTNNLFNVVFVSGTGSPGSLLVDSSQALKYNPNTDYLVVQNLSGVVITGSPTLSLGVPNASYKIQHFNINNCRVDGGSP